MAQRHLVLQLPFTLSRGLTRTPKSPRYNTDLFFFPRNVLSHDRTMDTCISLVLSLFMLVFSLIMPVVYFVYSLFVLGTFGRL